MSDLTQPQLDKLYKDALGSEKYNKMKDDLTSKIDPKSGEMLVMDRGTVLARIPEDKWKTSKGDKKKLDEDVVAWLKKYAGTGI